MKRRFEVVRDKFRKHPEQNIKLPERADSRSCAYDFYSAEDFILHPGERRLTFTDVKAQMFFDNRLEINTRSGNGTKHGIVLANTIGYIDASYYNNEDNDGNIGICLFNLGSEDFVVKVGDRIAQGTFTRYLIADDDKYKHKIDNAPRQGGFGSTGK